MEPAGFTFLFMLTFWVGWFLGGCWVRYWTKRVQQRHTEAWRLHVADDPHLTVYYRDDFS